MVEYIAYDPPCHCRHGEEVEDSFCGEMAVDGLAPPPCGNASQQQEDACQGDDGQQEGIEAESGCRIALQEGMQGALGSAARTHQPRDAKKRTLRHPP